MRYIWLIFTIIFIALARYHFRQSRFKIENIESKANIKTINGTNLGIAEFISEFNGYIDKQNRSNKEINIVQSVGYLVAAATALFSFFLS